MTPWFPRFAKLRALVKAEVKYRVLRYALDLAHRFLDEMPQEILRMQLRDSFRNVDDFGAGVVKLREILGERMTRRDATLFKLIEQVEQENRERMN